MIAALARGGVIGTGDGIPWELPRDRQHFRAYTAGKVMLLGRRTFEEMDGWFTTQRPIVLTRREDYRPGDVPPRGFRLADSVATALEHARGEGADELVVAGGAQVFALALPFATRLVLTEIDAGIDGDARFPDFRSGGGWREAERRHFPADDDNEFAMDIVTYLRAGAAAAEG